MGNNTYSCHIVISLISNSDMKNNSIKINILSPGRFHVCDLARELDKNGFDVKFYSFVPTRRAKKFGLPSHCSSNLYIPMFPFVAIERKFFPHKKWSSTLRRTIQDHLTKIYMRRADITIAMSGEFNNSVKKAKERGDIIIIERGSKHILEQKRILESIPTNKSKVVIDEDNIKREMNDYANADYIAIASEHVKRSFLIHHYPETKLFVNPYGVNVSMFHPALFVEKSYDLIMVGGWSLQKGCDLIIEAVRRTRLRFLHVGGIIDIEFPKDDNFTHIDPVDEKRLIDYYHQAKVFIFPSRQDGFGMVLSQALACNLPIIGSPDCGAPDLKEMVEFPEYITIIQNYSVESICYGIHTALNKYQELGHSQYAGNAIENLTWEAYGKRYANFLNQLLAKL